MHKSLCACGVLLLSGTLAGQVVQVQVQGVSPAPSTTPAGTNAPSPLTVVGVTGGFDSYGIIGTPGVVTTGYGRTTSSGVGFQGTGAAAKPEDYADKLLELYGKCLNAVGGPPIAPGRK